MPDHDRYDQPTGPRWITPDGAGLRTAERRPAPLPDLDEDVAAPKSRRSAMLAIGGAAAVAVGGAFFARGLKHSPDTPAAEQLFPGQAGGSTAKPGPAVPPATDGAEGKPSDVRTYPDQNASYMGSQDGEDLRANTPQSGRTYQSPQAAAEATEVTVETALAHDPVRHLASRVTWGATPKLLAEIKQRGIDTWLAEQLEPEKIAPTAGEMQLSGMKTLTMNIKQLRATWPGFIDGEKPRADRESADASIARMIWSGRQLLEVMVDFWNDFLHVPSFFDGGELVRPTFERDVIRKYALANYPDMFVAANKHPALLRYLNQDNSTKDAVNENLARENMELYSVGVDGGYTEKDVRQAALLQTGHMSRDDEYVYRPELHHVGPVKIMGFKHDNATAEGGEAADAYYRYLALHPSTARYIARSLATRFVADTPSNALVDALAKSYTQNKGRIRPVLLTLFSRSEFWASVGQKVRRPMEYLVASYRTLGVSPQTPATFVNDDKYSTAFSNGLREIRNKLEELGQLPSGMPTPNGYPDVFVAWTAAGTMITSWNAVADVIAGRLPHFTYTKPEMLVAKPPATAGAYVDALARRLIHQKLTARERTLLLAVAGVAAGDKVDATMNGAVGAVARAILASPQHHLR